MGVRGRGQRHSTQRHSERTVLTAGEAVKVIRHIGLLILWKDPEIEKHETFANFRHFLPEYRSFNVGFRARATPAREFDISYTLPSACARALAEGAADIGIIPAAAYTQIPGLQILPDVAIASRRAVRSILLVSKVPIEQVRTVALDTSSMTSVALTKVLFEKWLGGGRDFHADGARPRADAGAV